MITFRCYTPISAQARPLLASNLMTLIEGDRRQLERTAPQQVDSTGHAWVIDGHNDWTLLFDEEDPRVFSLRFRDERARPREQVFGRWLEIRLSNVEIVKDK